MGGGLKPVGRRKQHDDATLKRHGNHRPNRETAGPSSAAPDPPADLEKRALEEWNQMAPVLAASGLWGEMKRTILVQYCNAAADVERLEAKVKKEGDTCLSKKKTVYHNPTVALRDRAQKKVERLYRMLMARPPGRKTEAVAPEQSQYRRLMQRRVEWMREEGMEPDARSLSCAQTGSFNPA